MNKPSNEPKTTMKNALVVIFSTASLIASTACLVISLPAKATPQFAADTGKACGQCHESASGAGRRILSKIYNIQTMSSKFSDLSLESGQ